MTQMNYSGWGNNQSNPQPQQWKQFPNIGWVNLVNDGEQAFLRINISSTNQIKIIRYHEVQAISKAGKPYKKRIICLRDSLAEDIHKCPMCNASLPIKESIFIPVLQYTKDVNGNVVATPKWWEKSPGFAKVLETKLELFGPLKERVCVVTRHGNKGEQGIKYDFDVLDSDTYSVDKFPADFSAFNDSPAVGKFGLVRDLSFEEMIKELTPSQPQVPQPQAPQQTFGQSYQGFNAPLNSMPNNPTPAQAAQLPPTSNPNDSVSTGPRTYNFKEW